MADREDQNTSQFGLCLVRILILSVRHRRYAAPRRNPSFCLSVLSGVTCFSSVSSVVASCLCYTRPTEV